MPSAVIAMQSPQEMASKPNDSQLIIDANCEDVFSDEQPVIIRCGGCGHKICDRYYLLTVDRQWHCRCLKCSQCGQQLESQLTCFSRHGLIYCRQDYNRLFLWQTCVRCRQSIQPKQLVMRISAADVDIDGHNSSHYYHVDCFTCVTCDQPLRKGDHFGRHNNYIYCRYHYQQLIDDSVVVSGADHTDHTDHRSVNCALNETDLCDDKKSLKSLNDSYHQKTKVYKKRKTKLTQKFIDKLSSLSRTSSPLDSSRCDSPSTPSTLLSLSSARRAKRNRTSFKHQQLRAMKQYFNLNHNPDSKDLKQLSQRTGLAKRVLQVWFQNQRAKWRRSLLRQQSLGPQIVEECQPLTELNEYPLSCDEEQTIIEEEQAFNTYTHLY